MKSITSSILAVLGGAFFFCSSVYATSIVHAYTLTSAERAQFASSGAGVCPFWTADWAGRDSIYLDNTNANYPNQYGNGQWHGILDAQLSIKAAADPSGLFLCMVAEDDTFLDPTSDNYYQDCIDFLLDTLSAEEIVAGGKAITVAPGLEHAFAVTPSSQQFQILLGSTKIPDSLMYTVDDPSVAASASWANPWVALSVVALADLPGDHSGMFVKIFKVDATHRGMEMFMPWTFLGITGLANGDVLAGRSFALSGGYTDTDEPASPSNLSKRLRWNGTDPFNNQFNVAQTAWGDIIMPSDLAPVGSVSAVKAPVGHSLVSTGNIVKNELYNIQGKRISAGSADRNNSPVVERTLYSNGFAVSRISIPGVEGIAKKIQ